MLGLSTSRLAAIAPAETGKAAVIANAVVRRNSRLPIKARLLMIDSLINTMKLKPIILPKSRNLNHFIIGTTGLEKTKKVASFSLQPYM
jgi:hypothetical protein